MERFFSDRAVTVFLLTQAVLFGLMLYVDPPKVYLWIGFTTALILNAFYFFELALIDMSKIFFGGLVDNDDDDPDDPDPDEMAPDKKGSDISEPFSLHIQNAWYYAYTCLIHMCEQMLILLCLIYIS